LVKARGTGEQVCRKWGTAQFGHRGQR
jgi:hypothetical protein